eukprot:scaffold3929_cov136-Isochrysis_galbana.AAC.6
MRAEKDRRKEAEDGAAEERAQRKQAAAKKKAQEEGETVVCIKAFERCELGCVCGAPPFAFACPFAKWKRCPTCVDLWAEAWPMQGQGMCGSP